MGKWFQKRLDTMLKTASLVGLDLIKRLFTSLSGR